MANEGLQQMPEEDSNFVPEIEIDEQTGEAVDVQTRRKYQKPFVQKPYTPLNDFEG